MWQYLHHTLYDDSLYRDVKRGIPLGCPLSPRMGALCLHQLDERGFDFLGYRFSSAGLAIAPQTIERFVARTARLYEQGADEIRIGQYAERWWRWIQAGVTLNDASSRLPGALPHGAA
jgi:hypothetical protein